jgi:hypothetical protein
MQKYQEFSIEMMAYAYEIERLKDTDTEEKLFDSMMRSVKEFRTGLLSHMESRLDDKVKRLRERFEPE